MIQPAPPPSWMKHTLLIHPVTIWSPSLSSELQDTSIVENVENEFLPESEGQEDHTNLSPTDVFS